MNQRFMFYFMGFLVLVAGIGAAAYMMGVSMTWIAVGAVVLLGVGMMAAASRLRSA